MIGCGIVARREISNLLNRENRNSHNSNYEELYSLFENFIPDPSEGLGYLEDNRGVDFPLRNMTFNGENKPITDEAKNAILDAKVFGARIGYYYRLTFVGNGFDSKGKKRWGITLREHSIENFETNGGSARFIFIYNDDDMSGNDGNANWQKGQDGVDTITVDNGEIACSVTVDRQVISELAKPEFINLDSPYAPTAIIDPSNYFF